MCSEVENDPKSLCYVFLNEIMPTHTQMGVLEALGLDVPNFMKDVPNFVKNVPMV